MIPTDEELSKTATVACNVEVEDGSASSRLSTRPPSGDRSVSSESLRRGLSVGSITITATSVATATGDSPSATRPTTIRRSALERRPSNSSVLSTSVSSKQRSVTFKLDDDSDISSNDGSSNEVIGTGVGMLSTILLDSGNSHNNNTEMATSLGSNMSSNSALASNDDLGSGTEGGYRSEGSIGLVHGTSRGGTSSRRQRMFGASLRRDLPWAGMAEVDTYTTPTVSRRIRTESNSYDLNDAFSSSSTANGRIKAGRLTGTVITTAEEGLTQHPSTLLPSGESAQANRQYRALMALMRTECDQSHFSTSSSTSELSDETNTTRKGKRNHLFLTKCLHAIVVLVALSALSCAVLYFVAEEKVLPNRFYEQFFHKALSEKEDDENVDMNVRDLILKPLDSRGWGYDNQREWVREQKFHARRKRIEDRERRLRAKRDRAEQRFLSGNAGHSMLVRVSFVEDTSPKGKKKLDYSIVGFE